MHEQCNTVQRWITIGMGCSRAYAISSDCLAKVLVHHVSTSQSALFSSNVNVRKMCNAAENTQLLMVHKCKKDESGMPQKQRRLPGQCIPISALLLANYLCWIWVVLIC